MYINVVLSITLFLVIFVFSNERNASKARHSVLNNNFKGN